MNYDYNIIVVQLFVFSEANNFLFFFGLVS